MNLQGSVFFQTDTKNGNRKEVGGTGVDVSGATQVESTEF